MDNQARPKTNAELAEEQGVSVRQISRSRKRGYIIKDGKRKKWTAPPLKKIQEPNR